MGLGKYTRTNVPFEVCYGPLSPDHIVYSKTLPYNGELTKEGLASFVYSLTSAFGGAEFMSKEASAFIENWEAEAYRAKVAEK